MPTPSRLRLDPTTNLPNIKSFGELGSFLRGSETDDDTRRLSESMGELSVHIEAIIKALRTSRARTAVAPMLVDLLTVLRRHRTLVGNGPDALTRVSMIGNDMKLDSGVGTCGKEGQSVPVGVGQPTLRIDGLTVGGTA